MDEIFGILPDGDEARLYTISCGKVQAQVTNYGATLVRLWVPDGTGTLADVVLGYDKLSDYVQGHSYFGATVGRNANRIRNACFELEGQRWQLPPNFGPHSLHSGPDGFHKRLWKTEKADESSVTFFLHSPHGDQGFPGNADIRVTYSLENAALTIRYDGISDRTTVFNMTNHSYFNLAGHQNPQRAMGQILTMPAEHYTVTDLWGFPTGELRSVENTPMDFRTPKALGKEIRGFFKGYDHTFQVAKNPCAELFDPDSGRRMVVITDCPGVQVYTSGGSREPCKDGICYGKRAAVCFETQFYPDAVNHPQWHQPFAKEYHSQTTFQFSWHGVIKN